jgi:hypothetical protein
LEKGELLLADSIFSELVIYYESYFGKKSVELADKFYKLGSLKIDLSDFKSAEELLRQSLNIYEKYDAKMEINFSRVLNSLMKSQP